MLAQRFVREGVREDTAEAGVVGVVGGDDAVDADEEPQVLGERFAPGDLGVHVVPCGGRCEGKLVWGSADHVGGVGRVERVEPAGQVAGHGGIGDRELGRGREAGTREGCQGVEVDVVDGAGDGIGEKLEKRGQSGIPSFVHI